MIQLHVDMDMLHHCRMPKMLSVERTGAPLFKEGAGHIAIERHYVKNRPYHHPK